jgi:L-iditol 2-dehydrogenase
LLKALRLGPNGILKLVNEDLPTPTPGESLVRVSAVGICGSDIHWYEDAGIGDAQITKPLVLGHEFAGVIVEGERVEERVAVDPALPCWHCELCLQGHPNLCERIQFAGHGEQDGALREQLSWPDKNLYRIPDSILDIEGAMLEPLGVAIHAVELGKLKPGMSVGVYGCGPIGLLVLQMAQIMGAVQIIATDKLSHRLDVAVGFGATETYKAENCNEVRAVMTATKSRGVDVAFEVAGENEAVETAIETAALGARVVLVGIPREDRTSFQASSARQKGLTIKLSRRMKLTYPRAIGLVKEGLVDVKSIVTHEFTLDEYDAAFKVAKKREGLKVVIRPSA